MNTTDLIKRVRQAAFLEDTAVDYTDSVILGQMYDQMLQLYERAVVKSRQGYWFQSTKIAVTQGLATYAVPPRAIMNTLERVQIAYDNTLDFVDLPRVDETQAINYELGTGQTGQPARYVLRGRNIVLLPLPDSNVYTLRLEFYCRPSRLVPAQGNSAAGFITAVNNVAKTVTVSVGTVSFDSSGTPTSMAAGTWLIDVLSGNGNIAGNSLVTDTTDGGWHDFILTSQSATVSSSVWTFNDSTVDLSGVSVGDFVRASNQSEWPQLASDFHRTVADAAADKILIERRMSNPDLTQRLGDDLARFLDLLQPRALNTPAAVVVAPVSMYRGLRRAWPVKYP